jgi:hypothetical protein
MRLSFVSADHYRGRHFCDYCLRLSVFIRLFCLRELVINQSVLDMHHGKRKPCSELVRCSEVTLLPLPVTCFFRFSDDSLLFYMNVWFDYFRGLPPKCRPSLSFTFGISVMAFDDRSRLLLVSAATYSKAKASFLARFPVNIRSQSHIFVSHSPWESRRFRVHQLFGWSAVRIRRWLTLLSLRPHLFSILVIDELGPIVLKYLRRSCRLVIRISSYSLLLGLYMIIHHYSVPQVISQLSQRPGLIIGIRFTCNYHSNCKLGPLEVFRMSFRFYLSRTDDVFAWIRACW